MMCRSNNAALLKQCPCCRRRQTTMPCCSNNALLKPTKHWRTQTTRCWKCFKNLKKVYNFLGKLVYLQQMFYKTSYQPSGKFFLTFLLKKVPTLKFFQNILSNLKNIYNFLWKKYPPTTTPKYFLKHILSNLYKISNFLWKSTPLNFLKKHPIKSQQSLKFSLKKYPLVKNFFSKVGYFSLRLRVSTLVFFSTSISARGDLVYRAHLTSPESPHLYTSRRKCTSPS